MGRGARGLRHTFRSSPTIGQATVTISGYRDFVAIGRGASSVVYRAEQTSVGRFVAVKVLHGAQPRQAERRFQREKESIARLGGHTNIVQIFDAGLSDEGWPFVSMELYDESAGDRLGRQGSFAAADAISIAARIADAVDFAHRSGIFHRDIKPENVLLSELKCGLADFGIARSSEGLDQTQTLEMSPLHAAPEVFGSNYTPAASADIWSLGSLLYALLAGRAPFESTSPEGLFAYAQRLGSAPLPQIPRGDLPEGTWSAIERALRHDPARRWPSAGAMAQALQSCLGPLEPTRSRLGWDEPVAGTTTVGVARRAVTGDRPPPGPDGGQGWVEAPEKRDATTPVNGATLYRDAPTPAGDRYAGPTRHRGRWIVLGVTTLVMVVVIVVALVGRGSPTGHLPARLPAAAPTPAAGDGPTDLTVTAPGTQATLRWTDASKGADRYIVAYRSTTGPSQTVAVPSGQDNLTISGLQATAGYCFRVIGVSAGANGALTQAHADTAVRGCTLAPGS